ncbi:hypothetical protein DFH09DRAFT_1067442 [Mycena vulgaris]|nr:hypothetical protein DFH09DRAFT_1067442 [Mycena vulgaris]
MPDIGPALPPHLLARPDASEADDERQLPPPAAARRQRLQLRGRLRAGRPPPGHARSLLLLLLRATHIICPRQAAAAPRERRLRKEALRGVEEHARVNMHDGPLPLPPLLRFHLTSPCLLRLSPFLPPRSHFPPTPLLSRSLPPRMGGAHVSQGLVLRAISGLGARALAVWGCGARSPVSTRTRGVPSGDGGFSASGGCSADADAERGEVAMCAAPPLVLARARLECVLRGRGEGYVRGGVVLAGARICAGDVSRDRGERGERGARARGSRCELGVVEDAGGDHNACSAASVGAGAGGVRCAQPQLFPPSFPSSPFPPFRFICMALPTLAPPPYLLPVLFSGPHASIRGAGLAPWWSYGRMRDVRYWRAHVLASSMLMDRVRARSGNTARSGGAAEIARMVARGGERERRNTSPLRRGYVTWREGVRYMFCTFQY